MDQKVCMDGLVESLKEINRSIEVVGARVNDAMLGGMPDDRIHDLKAAHGLDGLIEARDKILGDMKQVSSALAREASTTNPEKTTTW